MVRLVLSPLLGRLPSLDPPIAAVDHQRRITWVVGPLMAVEGVTADEIVRSLISTNWIRTAAWTTRGLVLAVVLAASS